MATRQGALDRAREYFDRGFRDRLAALVAIPSTSQDPAHAADCRRYLEEAIRPWLAGMGFSVSIHDNPAQGFGPILTAERIEEIWMDVQAESLGPALRFDQGYRTYWAYIPHFIHSPFYVYAYAFGDCLVNSLYAVYQDAADGFAERYLKMLSAGGTLRHQELLAPFGLNASDPAFWDKGLGVIRGFIDELERADG